MDSYRIRFFKNLTSSDGTAFKICQRVIDIHQARDRDRAIRAAKTRFARLEGVGDWKLHADQFAVDPLGREALRPATMTLRPPVA